MIKNIVLQTTETNIITVPVDKEYTILAMMFCNTSATEKSITCYLYNGGTGSAGNSTTFIKNLFIPAEDTYTWTSNEKLILGAGDILSGRVSVYEASTPVSVVITYLEL
jgi:hypothetical protein